MGKTAYRQGWKKRGEVRTAAYGQGQKKYVVMRKKVAALCAAMLIVQGVFHASDIVVYARPESLQGVHIDVREVENGTLIVGTHLISLKALDDTIYKAAMQSAKDSGQMKEYYKSELGDGAWFEVDSSSSFKDITQNGAKIDAAVIDDLLFTYKTGSDHITYDLRTGQPVSVFDIQSPYDLNTMPELASLQNQREIYAHSGRKCPPLETFFAKEDQSGEDQNSGTSGQNKPGQSGQDQGGQGQSGQDQEGQGHSGQNQGGQGSQAGEAQPPNWDETLSSLEGWYQELAGQGTSPDILKALRSISKRMDASRRFESDRAILDKLKLLLNEVSSSSSFSGDSDLTNAIGTSTQEIQKSMDEAEGNAFDKGEGAQNQTEYDLMQEVLAALQGGDKDTALKRLGDLDCLHRIMDGESKDVQQEKMLLEKRLLPKAQKLFDESGSESAKGELVYFQSVLAGLEQGKKGENAWEAKEKEKQSLQTKLMQALDQEDMGKAKELEGQLAKTSAGLEALEADGIYGKGSTMENIRGLTQTSLKLVKQGGDYPGQEIKDGVKTGLLAIQALGPASPAASSKALGQLIDAMKGEKERTGKDNYDRLLKEADGLLAEYTPMAQAKPGKEELFKELQSAAGVGLDGKDPKKDAEALAGLALFCEKIKDQESKAPPPAEAGISPPENQAILSNAVLLLEEKAGQLTEEPGQPTEGSGQQPTEGSGQVTNEPGQLSDRPVGYVFHNINGPGQKENYIPVDALAAFCSYRYVWNNNQKRAVLSKGSDFYEFTAFSSKAVHKKAKDKMDSKTLYQKVLYLPESYAKKEFGCSSCDLSGTGYSVLVDKKTAERASEICDVLLQKGGI